MYLYQRIPTKVHHIDYEVFNILNLFSKATTIVYGE